MEIDSIFYKAKDGRIFTDPLECEQYEKTIGIVSGSIADMLRHVKENADDAKYVSGAVYYRWPDGSKTFHKIITMCIDDKLESFVNVKDLREEQRYVAMTMEDFLAYYSKEDMRDFPCQYLLSFSDDLSGRIAAVLANGINREVWKPKEDK